MRKNSFEGFLLNYAQELTGSNTSSLRKLLELSFRGCSRAFEPVLLLFILKERGSEAWKLVSKTHFRDSARSLLDKAMDEDTLMHLLAKDDDGDDCLERYRKVYRAYRNNEERLAVDREVSLLLREKTLALMEKKGLSNYRVYTDLSLNHGNVNAFLKNGDASKVSRKTARKMFDYVQSA